MSAFQDMNQPLVSVPAANDVMENSTANTEPSTSHDVTSPSVSVSVPAANDIMENMTANTVPSRACDVSLLLHTLRIQECYSLKCSYVRKIFFRTQVLRFCVRAIHYRFANISYVRAAQDDRIVGVVDECVGESL